MKQVRKKSADEAVNQMLIAAFRKHIDLAWDRSEAQQPHCGFGRLSICCDDCYAGPCRINPFGEEEQYTICGRSRSDLAAAGLLKKAADGTAALEQLAGQFGAEVGCRPAGTEQSTDEMLPAANTALTLRELGIRAGQALAAITRAKTAVYGEARPDTADVNLGALSADTVNIIVHGHIAPPILHHLVQAARTADCPTNIAAVCGCDAAGLVIPVLTGYESQETVLLTGAADLLVIGRQCVMPAMLRLAGKLGVPVYRAEKLTGPDHIQDVIRTAADAFRRRGGQSVSIPAVKAVMNTGYTAANSQNLLQAIAAGCARGDVRGLVYLGGCGNMDNTQDEAPVRIARDLIQAGYVIAAAGCAGLALAKASLADPDQDGGNSGLKAALPGGTPAVLYLGSCHDAGEFLAFAQAADASGIPVRAVIPEITHHKTLATAIAFAAAGITTLAGTEQIFADTVAEEILRAAVLADNGARVLPWNGLEAAPEALAEAAATK